MAIDATNVYTNAYGTASNVGSDGQVNQNTGSIDKTQFLSLLITELKNQDPTAPTDQKETLSQLAQFSSLEQMQSLNQTLTASSNVSQIAQSALLIGKTVTTAANADGSAGVSGPVSSVSVQGGKTYLHIGAQDVDAATVTGIR